MRPSPRGQKTPSWTQRTQTFLGQLGSAPKTERARLQTDYDRAARVVTEIDTASAASNDEESA
ncbi:hypothetical protein ACWDRR_33105 [Kitasatospora sp. NPDC003701]